MGWNPPSADSLLDLRKVRDSIARRGDDCLATLLAGVELYVSLGREMELLEAMRNFAYDVREAVENTPSADELRRLYEREDPHRSSSDA